MSIQPTLAMHRLNLYNPGRMTDAEIVAAFIARRSQFDRIVADLAAESATSRAQHHLIVGQRGMGKTTLLVRLAAELRASRWESGSFPWSSPRNNTRSTDYRSSG